MTFDWVIPTIYVLSVGVKILSPKTTNNKYLKLLNAETDVVLDKVLHINVDKYVPTNSTSNNDTKDNFQSSKILPIPQAVSSIVNEKTASSIIQPLASIQPNLRFQNYNRDILVYS